MLLCVGLPVLYVPHADHEHLAGYAGTGIAAVIGRLNADGTADLATFVPNKEMSWADAVPMGEGPHTFGPIGPKPDEDSEGALAQTETGADAATGTANGTEGAAGGAVTEAAAAGG